jgi:hypothetical protein
MVGDLEVSHEMQEAIKLATDENFEARASLPTLKKILFNCY